jgi:N-acetylglutamate synthase-like GNAT family acetyltransferase
LNSALGELPAAPTSYYIHDLALLPECRGGAVGSAIVGMLVAQARGVGVDNLSLVAVHDSVEFWRRHGFRVVVDPAGADPARAEKLHSYDEAACFMVRQFAG